MKPITAEIAWWFWRLVPANPILVRVVEGGSKRIQHLWARTAYLIILLFFVGLVLMLQGNTGGSLGNLAKASTKMFEGVSILQLTMMCLLAPIFTAGAISQEKDAETFNVLLTTPLTNAQIVLGSLLSRLFFVITLLLSGLPIFCITMLFGGVTGEQIFLSFGIAGCSAIMTGSLAIAISVIRIGTRGTVFSFHLGVAVFLGAGLAMGLWSPTFVPESIVPGTQEGMSWLAPLHPFLALGVAMKFIHPPHPAAVESYVWPVDAMLASPPIAFMLITLLASVVLVGLSTIFVRRGIKQGELTWWSKLWKRFGRGKNGERSRRARKVWSNPVAWREAVTRSGAASSNLTRYSYLVCGILAAVLLLLVYWKGGFATIAEARNWLRGVVVIEFVIVILMATNTAATAISREREARTVEMLLTTPLTSPDIIWGKLRGLISFTIPLMAVPALTVVAAAVFDGVRGSPKPIVYVPTALFFPPLLLIYSAFACMLGLHMSLKCQRSVQAVLASVGVLMAIGLGLAGVVALIGSLGPVGAVMAPLTFVMGMLLVLDPAGMVQNLTWTEAGLQDVQICLMIGTLITIGLYGAIVTGTYRSMVKNFDMIVRKQSR